MRIRKTFGRHPIATTASLVLAALTCAVEASPGDPLGPEFLVNSTTVGAQHSPAVAMTPDGEFAAVWISETIDGNRVMGQRFAVGGRPRGMEMAIGSGLPGIRWAPRVAMSKYGHTTLVWESQGEDGDGRGIFSATFCPGDAPCDGQEQINWETAGDQSNPAVAVDFYGGRRAYAWSTAQPGAGYGLRARLFRTWEPEPSAELLIDLDAASTPRQSALAIDTSGVFVVVWTAPATPEGPAAQLVGRRYDADGYPIGERFLISEADVQANQAPAIAMDRSGQFVVVWERDDAILGRRYDASGNALSNEFRIDGAAPVERRQPAVAIDASGLFVVTWESQLQDGDSWGVFGRRYAIDGNPLVSEFAINGYFAGAQRSASVAMDADGEFVIAWSSANQDGDADGIVARRFHGYEAIDLSLDIVESSDPVGYGSWYYHTITVSNNAPWNAIEGIDYASGVTVRIETPGGVSSYGPSAENTADWTCEYLPDAIECTYGRSLYPGGGESTGLVLSYISPYAPTSNTTRASVGADQVDPLMENNSAQVTTQFADIAPDVFHFTWPSNVELNTLLSSETRTISGLGVPVRIAVSGGEYSLNGAPFTATEASAYNGDTVQVRHRSSDQYGRLKSTRLYIGSGERTFISTTRAKDSTPDAFAFDDVASAARNSVVTSNAITILGLDDAPISVIGGAYSIDNGPFTTAAGIVRANQLVRVQHTTATAFSTAVDTTLSIGSVSDTFRSTTEAPDATPAPFAFVDQTAVATAQSITSASVTISGINVPATVSVSGGTYSINGGAFTALSGSVNAGDQVRLQHTSSAAANSPVITTLTMGGVSDTFTSTTGASDTTPNPFVFSDVTGAKRSRSIVSNSITVTGINTPVAITASGSGAQYSKNGAAFTSIAGTVSAGDTLRLRLTSAPTPHTTVSAVVTIGGVSDTWSVTTGAH